MEGNQFWTIILIFTQHIISEDHSDTFLKIIWLLAKPIKDLFNPVWKGKIHGVEQGSMIFLPHISKRRFELRNTNNKPAPRRPLASRRPGAPRRALELSRWFSRPFKGLFSYIGRFENIFFAFLWFFLPKETLLLSNLTILSYNKESYFHKPRFLKGFVA